jgi:hypothetical protein
MEVMIDRWLFVGVASKPISMTRYDVNKNQVNISIEYTSTLRRSVNVIMPRHITAAVNLTSVIGIGTFPLNRNICNCGIDPLTINANKRIKNNNDSSLMMGRGCSIL